LVIPTAEHIVDELHADYDLENFSRAQLPWSPRTSQDEYLSALSGPTSLSERPGSDFLARLPISDPVSHATATVLMQTLRAFPQMMLRRETLPPFIHGHWYRLSSARELSLAEPLINCMGIAQVFASHNAESKSFLWRTIKMEQRSFIEKVRSLLSFLRGVLSTRTERSYFCKAHRSEAISLAVADISSPKHTLISEWRRS
jgi:hypothetical protein